LQPWFTPRIWGQRRERRNPQKCPGRGLTASQAFIAMSDTGIVQHSIRRKTRTEPHIQAVRARPPADMNQSCLSTRRFPRAQDGVPGAGVAHWAAASIGFISGHLAGTTNGCRRRLDSFCPQALWSKIPVESGEHRSWTTATVARSQWGVRGEKNTKKKNGLCL